MAEKIALRPAVLAVFVNSRGEILIGSSPRDGGYKIPQGGLDEGETPRQGVIREVREELGIILEEKNIIFEATERVSYLFPKEEPLRNAYKGQEFRIFHIKYEEFMNPLPQDDEFDTLLWIKPEQLDNYDTRHRAEAYGKALKIIFHNGI